METQSATSTHSPGKSKSERPSTLHDFTDAATEAIARAIAGMQREAEREHNLRQAEHRARMAELETRLISVSEVERRLVERLATLKDGLDAPPPSDVHVAAALAEVLPAIVAQAVGAHLAAHPPAPGRDAESVTAEQITVAVIAAPEAIAAAVSAHLEQNPPPAGRDADQAVIAEQVARAVAAIPPAVPGKDADPEVLREAVAAEVAKAVAALPPALPGRDADSAAIVEEVARAVAALPPAQPGKDADPEAVRRIVLAEVERAVAAIPAARDGADVDMAAVARLIEAEVAKLPPATPGRDADPAEVERMVAEAVAALPPAKDGPPGKLPLVRAWEDRVHYEGDVVTLDGSTYQAQRDTGRAPPHDDWTCIARAGVDGRSFRVRNTYSETEGYLALDVVALNGAAFVARKDDPGPCPGAGWQMIASQGKPGKPGEPGRSVKGDPGRAATVAALSVDDEGLLTLRNADGTEVTCDLYPVLSKVAG